MYPYPPTFATRTLTFTRFAWLSRAVVPAAQNKSKGNVQTSGILGAQGHKSVRVGSGEIRAR
jgi:hypothetical protein